MVRWLDMAKSSRKSEICNTQHATRKRWFNFGPGIAIALVISAVVVYYRYQEQNWRQPPRIERTVVSDKPSAGVVPEISSLLLRREELKLSAQQVKEIEELQAEWQRASTSLHEKADKAAEQFKRWMDEAQKRGHVAIDEVQQHGAEVSALSAELVRQRRVYWESAMKLLTEEQRKQIERGGKQ